MRNYSFLREYNALNYVSSAQGVLIKGRSSQQLATFPPHTFALQSQNTDPLKEKGLFFCHKSRTYLFRGLLVTAIERGLNLTFGRLQLKGIGFKCHKLSSRLLLIRVGFTHKFYYRFPADGSIQFMARRTKLLIYGSRADAVKNTLHQLKGLRFPDSYKGKGIMFAEEKLRLKSSKKRI